MATIRQQKNKKWQAIIRRTGYPPESRTFSLERDAEIWARDRERDMDRGLYLPRAAAEKMTMLDLADLWKKAELPKRRSKGHYGYTLGQIRDSDLKDRAIATITSADAAKFRDRLLGAKLATSTVNKVLIFAAQLVDYGIENAGLVVAANPFRQIRKPSEPDHRSRRLIGDEEARLFKAIETRKHALAIKALVTMAIETGCRAGELFGLQWAEIDFDKRVAEIRGIEIDGKRQLKNGSKLRHCPLSPTAIMALQSLPRPIGGGRVFNQWPNAVFFNVTWHRILNRAGITDLRFHDLRHEFASRMAPRVEMHVLMKLLGHRSPTMVARYYNQTADDVAALAKKLYG